MAPLREVVFHDEIRGSARRAFVEANPGSIILPRATVSDSAQQPPPPTVPPQAHVVIWGSPQMRDIQGDITCNHYRRFKSKNRRGGRWRSSRYVIESSGMPPLREVTLHAGVTVSTRRAFAEANEGSVIGPRATSSDPIGHPHLPTIPPQAVIRTMIWGSPQMGDIHRDTHHHHSYGAKKKTGNNNDSSSSSCGGGSHDPSDGGSGNGMGGVSNGGNGSGRGRGVRRSGGGGGRTNNKNHNRKNRNEDGGGGARGHGHRHGHGHGGKSGDGGAGGEKEKKRETDEGAAIPSTPADDNGDNPLKPLLETPTEALTKAQRGAGDKTLLLLPML